MPSTNSLFVTGCFRSGTSLLYACLNQHPDIAIMYETGMLSIPLSKKLIYHNRWLENANAWGKFLARHGLPAQPTDAANYFDNNIQIYKAYASKKGARYFGEKCPSLMINLKELAKNNSKAKIITIFRHPMEIHHSVIKAGLNDNFFSDPQLLNRQLYAQEKMYHDIRDLNENGYNILNITYNELCDQPEVTCRKICAYLEIPYTEKMIDLTDADMSAVYLSKHHIKLREGTIVKSPHCEIGISPELRQAFEALNTRWEGMHNFLINKENESIFSEPLNPISEVLIKEGFKSYRRLRLKRQIYHLAPAETIRFFRAIKVMLHELKELKQEHLTHKQLLINQLLAGIFFIVFTIFGSVVYVSSVAIFSPLFIYMLVPITSAWLAGYWFALLTSLITVLSFCLCENYVPPPDTLFSFIWNFFSRFLAFGLIIIFTLHLKATFLRFQKNIPKD